uniref:Uncharacterized protein n=1 Tax=Hyaloperonospora arabidopsidis (strain Emoy2) TaxID=559515 RepID=M4BLW3_HYAAE
MTSDGYISSTSSSHSSSCSVPAGVVRVGDNEEAGGKGAGWTSLDVVDALRWSKTSSASLFCAAFNGAAAAALGASVATSWLDSRPSSSGSYGKSV